jgi:hypothetical protein
MGMDAYREGYASGGEAAGLCPVAIQCTDGDGTLALLAGHKLEAAVRRAEAGGGEVYYRSAHWRTGFFDGFLDRAMQILSGRR